MCQALLENVPETAGHSHFSQSTNALIFCCLTLIFWGKLTEAAVNSTARIAQMTWDVLGVRLKDDGAGVALQVGVHP